MTSESRPYTFDRVVRLVISTLGILAALWLIDTLRAVLLPFLVAWLIAYMLEPFVQYNMRLLRVRKRFLPIFVTLFETVLLLVALGVVFMPDIAKEMRQMAVLFNNYARARERRHRAAVGRLQPGDGGVQLVPGAAVRGVHHA